MYRIIFETNNYSELLMVNVKNEKYHDRVLYKQVDYGGGKIMLQLTQDHTFIHPLYLFFPQMRVEKKKKN